MTGGTWVERRVRDMNVFIKSIQQEAATRRVNRRREKLNNYVKFASQIHGTEKKKTRKMMFFVLRLTLLELWENRFSLNRLFHPIVPIQFPFDYANYVWSRGKEKAFHFVFFHFSLPHSLEWIIKVTLTWTKVRIVEIYNYYILCRYKLRENGEKRGKRFR